MRAIWFRSAKDHTKGVFLTYTLWCSWVSQIHDRYLSICRSIDLMSQVTGFVSRRVQTDTTLDRAEVSRSSTHQNISTRVHGIYPLWSLNLSDWCVLTHVPVLRGRGIAHERSRKVNLRAVKGKKAQQDRVERSHICSSITLLSSCRLRTPLRPSPVKQRLLELTFTVLSQLAVTAIP